MLAHASIRPLQLLLPIVRRNPVFDGRSAARDVGIAPAPPHQGLPSDRAPVTDLHRYLRAAQGWGEDSLGRAACGSSAEGRLTNQEPFGRHLHDVGAQPFNPSAMLPLSTVPRCWRDVALRTGRIRVAAKLGAGANEHSAASARTNPVLFAAA